MKQLKLKLMSIALACAMLITVTPSVFGLSLPFSPLSRMSTEKGIHTPTVRINEETLGYDIFDALEILKHLVGMTTLTPFEKEVYTFTDNNGSPSIFDALEVLKGLVKMRPLPRINPLFPPTSSNNLPTEKVGGAWTSASEGRYKPPAGWKNAEYPWTPPSDWIEYDEDGSWGPGGGTTGTTHTDETSDDSSDTAPTDTTDVTETDETNTSLSDITTSSYDIGIDPTSDTTNSSTTEATTTTENTTSTAATTTTEDTTSTAATTTTANTTSTAATTSSAATTTAATTTSATTTTATTTAATTITEVSTSLDPSAPTGQISIKSNTFTSFFNGVTFGMFFKNTVDVTITSPDVVTIEYFLSETTLTSGTDWDTITWETYSAPFSVDADFKGVVYAKFTKTENELTTIINSNGLVVFIDSNSDGAEINYVKNSGIDQTVEITLNGNTVSRIVYNGNPLNNGDYEVNDNRITFKSSFLETLSVGDNQKLTVFYNPLGVEFVDGDDNENVSATEIIVNILPAQETSTDTSETGTSESSETSSGGTTSSYTTSSGGTTSSYTTSSGGTTVSSVSSTSVTTTSVTSASTTPGQTGQKEFVIFDMQSHPELDALAVEGGGVSSDNDMLRLPFASRHSGPTGRVISVVMTNPRTITITGCDGSTQGVQFRLNDIPLIANHTYKFSTKGTTSATAAIRNGATSGGAALVTAPNSGAFDLTFSRTVAEITADKTSQGEKAVYAIVNSSGAITNMTITEMSIVRVCPTFDCTACNASETTTTVTSAATPATTDGGDPVGQNVIYDLQNDSNLSLFTDGVSHPILANYRTATELSVNTSSSTKTLTVLAGNSSASGLDIKLSGLDIKTNHSYKFDITASIAGGNGTANFQAVHSVISRQNGNDGTGSVVSPNLTSVAYTNGTNFTLSHTASYSAISGHAALGTEIRLYRLGGFANRTLTVSGLVITSICPQGCTSCVSHTITFNAGSGATVTPTSAKTGINGKLTSLPTPTRTDGSGLIFAGWYKSATGNDWVGKHTVFTANTTVYAQWRTKSNNATGVDFAKLTAAQLVEDMGFGWNLGNTLDAPSEGQWAPAATKTLIDGVKAAGFDTIRIPVTWGSTSAPKLSRVKTVVDWALANNMYVIINSHHDEDILNVGSTSSTNSNLTTLWTNIANTFKDYDHRLIFEGLNEPRPTNYMGVFEPNPEGNAADGYTAAQVTAWLKRVNDLNQVFVNAVRATGGNNAHRILMCPTYAATAQLNAMNAYKVPTDSTANMHENPSGDGTQVSRKIVMSIHTYHPVDFAVKATTTVWAETGSGSITTRLTRVKTRADELGIPVILGEWGATNNPLISSSQTERTAERARYSNAYIRVATSLGMRACLWDNGKSASSTGEECFGFIDRNSGASHFPAIINAIKAGREGKSTW